MAERKPLKRNSNGSVKESPPTSSNQGNSSEITLTPSNILLDYNSRIKSRIITVIGLVDQVFPVHNTRNGDKTILKWNLNNGDGERIQCVAWNRQIKRIQSKIVLGNVLLFNGIFMSACNQSFINGTFLFQLTVQSNTVVEIQHELGPNIHKLSIMKSLELVEIPNVCDYRKCIRVAGFIKTNFALIERGEGLFPYCFGVIGEDEYCLEIKIIQFDNPLINVFEVGQHVEIQGFMKKSDSTPPQLTIRTMDDIELIDGIVKDMAYLCHCTQSPEENSKKLKEDT